MIGISVFGPGPMRPAGRTLVSRIAAFVAVCLLSTSGVVRGDWTDDFAGNQDHDPADGAWGYVGLTLAAAPQDIPNWTPQFASERVVVPSPGAPGGLPMFLAAGYVGDITGTAHRYQNVRVGGNIAVGNNGGAGNNNLIGLLARANDYDSYVLAVNYDNGTINLVKSSNADAANPIYMTSQAISGFAELEPFFLQMDVQDFAGGTRLVGRVYEDESRSNLLNTIFAFDDAGEAVPGAAHSPYYSGWVVQFNNRTATTPTTIDASFDNMFSLTLRPGDVNFDGRIDRSDVAQLSQHFGMTTGATWDEGDVDGNGRVDMFDLTAVQSRMTAGGPVVIGPPVDIVAHAAAAAVPEPSSVALALLGLAATAVAAGRRRASCGAAA